jgi:hypothetical protein
MNTFVHAYAIHEYVLGHLVCHSTQVRGRITIPINNNASHRTRPRKEIPISPAPEASTPHQSSPAGIASENLPTLINLKRHRYGRTVSDAILGVVPLQHLFLDVRDRPFQEKPTS